MISTRMTRLSAGFALFLAFWAGCTGTAKVAEAQPAAKAGALLSLTVGGTPDKVVVERTGDVWTVHTKPDVVDADGTVIEHHDKAWCDTEQRFYHMPFTVTIGLKP